MKKSIRYLSVLIGLFLIIATSTSGNNYLFHRTSGFTAAAPADTAFRFEVITAGAEIYRRLLFCWKV